MPSSQTTRVIIRPPVPGDWRAFLSAVSRSRALHKSWVSPKAGTRREFANYLKRFSADRSCGFLVIERESGGIVGVININDLIQGSFRSASLGYYAFSPWAGRGLMHEGMLLVLKFAFIKLKLHRLEANILPGNQASITLVRKCGFVREGFSRRMLKVCGRWRDHERWALLAEDFKARKRIRRST